MSRKYYKYQNRQLFYASKFKEQNGCCALCGRQDRLVIDHDHKTGLMRSLLCYKHNSALGLFEDNPDLLKVAINYLENHALADPVPITVSNYERNPDVDAIVQSLLDDNSYPSNRARARALSARVNICVSTAQTKIHRAANKRKLDKLALPCYGS